MHNPANILQTPEKPKREKTAGSGRNEAEAKLHVNQQRKRKRDADKALLASIPGLKSKIASLEQQHAAWESERTKLQREVLEAQKLAIRQEACLI